jgi:stage II sporulation protein D
MITGKDWIRSRLRQGFFPFVMLMLLGIPAGCAHKDASAPAVGVPVVRVRLLEAQSQLTVAASDTVAFREAPGVSPRPLNVPRKQTFPVQRTQSGWRIGDVNVDANVLTLLPTGETGSHLSINGKPYRGDFRLVPVSAGKFDVVNDVDLESYLKGVLAKEMLRDWHEEAYKAQAIVARTYALFEMKTVGVGRYWDVYPDQRSQVYGGIGGENGLSMSASNDTAGVVVAYGPKGHEKIFKAYFSSCCGGITQSAVDAFGDPASDPLSDQNVGNRCNNSRYFNWGPVEIRKEELTRRVRNWGIAKGRAEKDVGPITRLDIAYVNRWGRPIRFTIIDKSGRRFSIGGTDLRGAINCGVPGTTVFSSFFTPVNEADSIRFVDGHGFGHGVGLCQYCAEAQAESGVPHEEIVLGAYPGASLQRAY